MVMICLSILCRIRPKEAARATKMFTSRQARVAALAASAFPANQIFPVKYPPLAQTLIQAHDCDVKYVHISVVRPSASSPIHTIEATRLNHGQPEGSLESTKPPELPPTPQDDSRQRRRWRRTSDSSITAAGRTIRHDPNETIAYSV